MKKTASLAVLAILLKNNFETYFIGSKSRNELNNKLFPEDKLATDDIHIFTNANYQDVLNIFENSEFKNDLLNTVIVSFGGFNFEVSTCSSSTCSCENFMYERDKRDITINTIAQNFEGQYFDYTYVYRNQTISAIKDLKERKIRSVGNPYQRFEDDPTRIIRIFRIMAQTGYEIEKTTLKAASIHLKLLKNISTMQIGEELNKLIVGKSAAQALLKMDQIGMFKAKIFNPFLEKHIEILPILRGVKIEQLLNLTKYNNYRYHRDGYNRTLDCWVLLLNEFKNYKILDMLHNLHPVNFDDMDKIKWMLDNYNIVNSGTFKQDVIQAKVGIVEKNNFFTLYELICKLLKINTVLNGFDALELSKKIIFEMCSRPYFIEQINGTSIKKFLNLEDEEKINKIKERMLPKILFSGSYPNNQEYEKIILESAKEVEQC